MLIKQDKIEHWAFGFVFTLFYLIRPELIFSSIIFAIGKEIYDHYYGSGWSSKDLLATLLGACVGAMFLVVIL